MSTKRNSTISTKPTVDPALHWIGGAAAQAAQTVEAESASLPASQQNNMQTSKQTDKKAVSVEPEPTQMLSVRVPTSLIRKLRIRAATEGSQIQEIVTSLLRDYLDEA